MPLFRYQCGKCNHRFELLLPRHDSPASCPDCGSDQLVRELNRVAAITKTGPVSCSMRHDCPSAGASGCGCGCGCGGHHH